MKLKLTLELKNGKELSCVYDHEGALARIETALRQDILKDWKLEMA